MSFDTLAPIYQWMERLCAGNRLQRCRTAFLQAIPIPRNVLLLGEGTGRFLVECRRQFPAARITCVDSSGQMIAEARGNLRSQGLDDESVRFIQADIFEWDLETGTYDLIVAHFFLDCFRADQLEVLIPVLASAGVPDAHWIIADFQVAESGWRRLRSRMILWIMYRFFRITTRLPARKLTRPDPFLLNAGFRPHQRMETEWGLLKSEWWRRSSDIRGHEGLLVILLVLPLSF